MSVKIFRASVVCALILAGWPALAEELPDAPEPSGTQAVSSGSKDLQQNQTSRYEVRSPLVTDHLPPQTVGAKFEMATLNSFNYPAFLATGLVAGLNQAQDYYPEFHQGAEGFGRYYWHGFVDQVVGSYTVGFVLPVVLRQDTRYYRLRYAGVGKRTGYALSRIFITRTDGGETTFNTSEIAGSGVAAGLSVLYYPSKEQTWGVVGERYGTNLAGDAFVMVLKEFLPEINHVVGNVVRLRLHRRP